MDEETSRTLCRTYGVNNPEKNRHAQEKRKECIAQAKRKNQAVRQVPVLRG